VSWVCYFETLTRKSAKVGSNKYKSRFANLAVANRRIEVVVSKMEITSHITFISLDISDFRQKNNCLKVFEMMKSPYILQPQTRLCNCLKICVYFCGARKPHKYGSSPCLVRGMRKMADAKNVAMVWNLI